MADISLIVDYQQVKQANQEILKIGSSAQKSASTFEKAFGRAERAQNQLLSGVRKQMSFQSRMAAQQARESRAAITQVNSQMAVSRRLEAQKRSEAITATKAAQAIAQQEERLRLKYVQGHAAMEIYTRELNDLAMARKKDIISADQQKQAVAELNTAMAKGTGVFANMGNAAMAGGRKMSGAGMAVQQVGYQAGDFLVQIQGGTNAFVAFGQQATQLVGVLPMVATQFGLTAKAAIGISAALGIIIPLTTAVAAAFMRTRQTVEALSLEDAYTAVADAANDAAKASGDFGNSARDGFIVAKTEALAFLEVLKSVRSEQLQVALDTALASTGIGEAIKSFNEGVNFTFAAEAMSGVGRSVAEIESSLADANVALGLNITQAREFESILRTVGGTTKSEIVDSFFSAVQSLKDANLLTDETNKLITQMADSLGIVEDAYVDLSDAQEVLKEGAQGFLNIWELITTQIKTAVNEAKKMPQTLSDDEFQQMLFYQAYGDSRAAAPSTPPSASGSSGSAASKAVQQVSDLQKELEKLNDTASKGLTPFDKYNTAIDHLNTLLAEGLSDAAYSMEIERLNDELAKSLPLVDDVADAFGDFLSRGLTDFKSFANSIFKSFQNMLAQMIASAARNRILISLGATGSMAGPASAASNLAQGAGMLGGVGTFASSVGTGLGVVGSGFAAGGFGGAATASMGAISGGIGMGGAMGLGTALGAALPVLGAVALAVSFFRSKTKELDSGLNVTVKNMDALVESFKTVEKSRFFGLSKRTSTSTGTVSDAVSGPIVSAVEQIQQSVLTAAEAFGIGANAFDNFSYQFKLSLKGLSEEQQMQKINEELTKMGDSFASLSGHFSSMNELLEAAEQRYQIENRMLQALGNSSELLARSRERELAATHALNRGLLQATFDLEDANAGVANAIEGLRRAIDAEKQGLQDRASVINEALSQTKAVFDMLSNALKSRRLQDDASFRMRRSSAQSFLRAGDTSDTKALEEALGVVSEPSEGLFGSFVDYARDFLTTSRDIADLEKTAQVQLTIEEQMLAAIESQLESLDVQYQTQIDQYNALLGIDTSVKSVEQAIASLGSALSALSAAQSAAKAAQAAGVGSVGGVDPARLGPSQKGVLEALSGGGGRVTFPGGGSHTVSDPNGLELLGKAYGFPGFAKGGMHSGGMRLVGEEGPELEVTGPSRIYSAQQTKGMLQGGGDNAGLRAEVSELRSELRQLAIANNKYTKRSYDLFNKWDIDGLPATRT